MPITERNLANSAITAAPAPSGLRMLGHKLRDALPQGQTLPDAEWERRHHWLLILLWAHVILLPLFALSRGFGLLHSLGEGSVVAAPAIAAMLAGHHKRAASAMVSFGLITSSAVLVHIWGGVIEAHFHFFVMIVVLSLYEDWLPFLLAAAYVVIHHGVMGALSPGSVYDHADAVAHPWRWAAIHGAFVTAAGIGSVLAWRLNEDVRAETRKAYSRARESEERFKSAFENAPIGMVLTSIDPHAPGRFLQVNRAMCEITGYPENELVGKSFEEITHPGDIDRGAQLRRRLLADEFPSFQTDKRYLRADGREVRALVNVSLVRDSAGTPLYTIAQVQDVTEQRRAQEQLAFQAFHDALTGLPNRRKLMEDLDERMRLATRSEPLLLLLFDLDGFKAYNDTFGHPAGDRLLARLGRRLQASVEGRGVAYRMGGDEFCVLGRVGVEGETPLASAGAAALSERGEGFDITASYGSVVLPLDAQNEEDALRKVDERLYARKDSRRQSAGRQATDALLKALAERSSDLGSHLNYVADLCQAVAMKLGIPEEEMSALLQAAALHDVGKVAIPDAILEKPGPLDDSEWEFMRTHTVIGERIVSAAPALAHAAKVIRSTHERFDGTGYPDALGGAAIPLASRIIAVCDAYDAMTSNRPYRTAMSVEGALSELRRNAGGQFDPDVVEAFIAAAPQDHRGLHSADAA
jgi:diguanylate cyclase (GGDEF)-like protein/PAS domain S-box-containing protein